MFVFAVSRCTKPRKTEPNERFGFIFYIKKELSDLLDASDLIISRAGANAICEILSLRKPNILIPLSKAASRGDQILNAASYEKQGFSKVIEEEALTGKVLWEAIEGVYQNKNTYIAAMEKSTQSDAVSMICDLIQQYSKGKKD